jgi:glycogen debranching enzyme
VDGDDREALPHFESGFPFGRDQFISAAGTNWAARALALAYTKTP